MSGWKMCQPCSRVQNLTHIDCTDPHGKLGLCQCWITSWVHCSKFGLDWTADEINDQAKLDGVGLPAHHEKDRYARERDEEEEMSWDRTMIQ